MMFRQQKRCRAGDETCWEEVTDKGTKKKEAVMMTWAAKSGLGR